MKKTHDHARNIEAPLAHDVRGKCHAVRGTRALCGVHAPNAAVNVGRALKYVNCPECQALLAGHVTARTEASA